MSQPPASFMLISCLKQERPKKRLTKKMPYTHPHTCTVKPHTYKYKEPRSGKLQQPLPAISISISFAVLTGWNWGFGFCFGKGSWRRDWLVAVVVVWFAETSLAYKAQHKFNIINMWRPKLSSPSNSAFNNCNWLNNNMESLPASQVDPVKQRPLHKMLSVKKEQDGDKGQWTTFSWVI